MRTGKFSITSNNKKSTIFEAAVIIGFFMVVAGVAGYRNSLPDRSSQTVLAATSSSIPAESSAHPASSMLAETYDDFFTNALASDRVESSVVSAVVPHHLLAGKYIAALFNALKPQNPAVVVIIGPNHPQAGNASIITSAAPWATPYGGISPDQEIINALAQKQLATIDEPVIGVEHTIAALTPFVKHTWPEARIVPLILKEKTSSTTITALAEALDQILPPNSLVLASVDFSHYLPEPIASFHDELSLNALATGDQTRLSKLEIDSHPSIQFLLAYNKLKHAENFHLFAHTNSATIVSQPSIAETTSHVLGYYTAGSPASSAVVTIQFFGDIMLDRKVAQAMGGRGLDYIFKNLAGKENRFFTGMDILAANLEGPFAPRRVATSKSIAFRFDPKFAPELQHYGFSAFSLANNHSYDMGAKNVIFTRKTLAQVGLGFFGDELQEGPEFTWVSSTTPPVAFIGIHNTYHDPDKTKILAAIADAKTKTPLVVAFLHWGEEYHNHSNQKQQALAHWLVDNGVTVVIGAHPHVVEEMEIYKGQPIFYSLGNFIFDQYFSEPTQEGLSVGLTLGSGGVKSIYLFPFYSVKSQVQLMSGTRRENFLKWFAENSRLGDKKIEDGRIEL